MRLSLCSKGIDVRILLPGIPDKVYINKIAKSYYKTMIDYGDKNL